MSKLIPKSIKDQETEFAEFVKLYTKGFTRLEICNQLELSQDSNRYELLLDRFYDEIQEDTQSKSPLKRFSEYIAHQNQIIRDLEKLKQHYESESFTQDKAYVSACKAQSDIYDKQINIGQKLGLINKAADKLELINGMDPRDMREPEIQAAIEEHVQKIQELKDDSADKPAKILAFNAQTFKREDNSESE